MESEEESGVGRRRAQEPHRYRTRGTRRHGTGEIAAIGGARRAAEAVLGFWRAELRDYARAMTALSFDRQANSGLRIGSDEFNMTTTRISGIFVSDGESCP